MNDPKTTEYRVWYIPQIPGEPFIFETDDLATAKLVEQLLCDYSLWEYEHRIKPDYADAGGIEVWREPDGYVDLHTEEELTAS